MRDIVRWLANCVERDGTAALATVVATHGSAPRSPGASLVVARSGEVRGGLSGGCVEADVYARAQLVLDTGMPEIVTYGPDVSFGAVSLTCGGKLSVLIESVTAKSFPALQQLADAVEADVPASASVSIGDGAALGMRSTTIRSQSGILHYGPELVSAFTVDLPSRPRMLLFGSSPHTAAMVLQGALLGYAVTVCDERPLFTTPERLPGAHGLVVARPVEYLLRELAAGQVDDRTVVLVMTHSDGVDLEILELALGGRWVPKFVGALASPASAVRKRNLLRQRGVPDARLCALSSPVGLNIGSATPEEVAVAVAAELVAISAKKTGGAEKKLNPTGVILK
ncbi:XdhC family protein [Hoyosella rhizosphaerae]|uniref:Xanthine dehydrogenase n=1 Tax=Hoyosella rhizosphaerae TaxID=1755582 RepID=A0A916U8T4_9ACTN|nr:XdhC family protein [Hoyosella rhizosphaerae]MBN4927572.1 XdhC family protein [Hoyosella rhizosphaerae]GGC63413.1 xanthine dehydrogenase [Hoyosella rhizosphaerae]